LEINVKHKQQEFFAIINDVDIKSLSNKDFLKIQEAINKYGVLVLKDQKINDDEQIEFLIGLVS
tara:strand:- start:236 stop:427 length:192 start_codon:yes stop_codon:yes gene_type:complete